MMTTHGPTIHAPATNLVKAKNDVEQIDKEKFSSTNKVSQYEFKQFRFGLEGGGQGGRVLPLEIYLCNATKTPNMCTYTTC